MRRTELEKKFRSCIGERARSTSVNEDLMVITVIYHETVVFFAYTDRSLIQLNHGGYRTKTTKQRINSCFQALDLPIRVIQKDYDWYLSNVTDGSIRSHLPGVCNLVPWIDQRIMLTLNDGIYTLENNNAFR